MKTALLSLTLLALAACTVEAKREPDDQSLLSLDLKNAILVEQHIVSSGQPTEEQFAKLPEAGYSYVIQLRPSDEQGTGWEEVRAKELGLRFVRIPVAGTEGLTEENARALDKALAEAGSEGTLVACGSGNRVGGLFALRAHFCAGTPPEQALELGKKAGLTSAEPAVRKVLGLP